MQYFQTVFSKDIYCTSLYLKYGRQKAIFDWQICKRLHEIWRTKRPIQTAVLLKRSEIRSFFHGPPVQRTVYWRKPCPTGFWHKCLKFQAYWRFSGPSRAQITQNMQFLRSLRTYLRQPSVKMWRANFNKTSTCIIKWDQHIFKPAALSLQKAHYTSSLRTFQCAKTASKYGMLNLLVDFFFKSNKISIF